MYSVIFVSPSRAQRASAIFAALIRRMSASLGARIGVLAAAADRLPSRLWPLLVAVAVWPDALWSTRRLLEPEAPLGIVACCALGLVLWQARARFAQKPRMAVLGAAVALAFVANLPMPGFPALVHAVIGNLAIVVAFASIADPGEPIAPYAGLALLALPLLESLQPMVNAPLSDVVGGAVRWLLAASRSEVPGDGATWLIDGRAVAVAPRGGLQLAWVGCFVACVTGWMFGLRNRAFIVRMPAVALFVTIGHVLRTTVLMSAAAGGVAMTDAMDAALSVLAVSAVGAATAFVFATGRRPKEPPVEGAARVAQPPAARPSADARWRVACAGLLLVSASVPLVARG